MVPLQILYKYILRYIYNDIIIAIIVDMDIAHIEFFDRRYCF